MAAAGEVSARVGRDDMGRGHGGCGWPERSDEWAERGSLGATEEEEVGGCDEGSDG